MRKDNKFTNQLINESSPYLIQHAHNPVNWLPWSDEAFQKAKDENKLIIISIGYSACHWCHVMERQSFVDEQVAALMNEHFISIKVDREERPDIDNVYMAAGQLITGKSGWPLNCIALPDGRPVYGGTYYTKENWMGLLSKIHELYTTDNDKLMQQAQLVVEGVKNSNLVTVPKEINDFTFDILKGAIEKWKETSDLTFGGASGAPKFPMPNGLKALIRYFYHTKDEDVKDYLEITLDNMAKGGIYDHLGGGFARYSIDEYWKVPHFEKMLYDNAQLISIYSEAYRLFRKERYKEVVLQSIEFLKRDLLNEEGGLFSAMDADSGGEEGRFYVWTSSEVDSLLGAQSEMFKSYYNFTDAGNWESEKNILFVTTDTKKIAQQNDVSEDYIKNLIAESGTILLKERNKREKPETDTKILTSWNALAISGLVEAYRALGEESVLELAIKIADYLLKHFVTGDYNVFRTKKKDGAPINGFLDDYGLLATAFLDLYQVSFNSKWLTISKEITEKTISNFYDKSQKVFSYKSKDDGELFSQNIELTDNVIPSSNSIMGNLIHQLSVHLDSDEYLLLSKNLLNLIVKGIDEYPSFFSNWLILLMKFVFPKKEIVFVGDEAISLRKEFEMDFYNAIVSGAVTSSDFPLLKDRFIEGKTLMYFCENGVCRLPFEKIEELKLRTKD